MSEQSKVSRRTLARGVAWSVPAVAVAAAAPVMATSVVVPPDPEFNWVNAIKNPGNSCTNACIEKQSYGVPVSLTNPTADNFIIKFTGYKFGADASGVGGTAVGVNNVGVVYGKPVNCATKVTQCSHACPGATSVNSVCIPAGTTTPITFWVFSNSFGSSPNGSQYIPWELINASTCVVAQSGAAYSSTSPPNDAC